jgi:Na+/melibiose symporter-like transporter
MIPDVIELDELQTGERREGVFYSFMVLLQKIGLALGLWLVGQALERAGFLATIQGQAAPVQPDSATVCDSSCDRAAADNCFNCWHDSHIFLSD